MKKILTGLFIFMTATCFSQSVKELEHELSFYKSGEEWGNKKNIAYKLLEIDSLNESAINYLVEVFGRNNQKDSISFLFDKLIKDNPQNPKLYLIRAEERNAHFAGLSNTKQIEYLKEAYRLDSLNVMAIYKLGKLYYELFIKENKILENEEYINSYSSNAIRYFSILCKLNEKYMESLKYPLIQLANYSNYTIKINLYKSCNIQSSYFPISAFIDLPSDWQTNYSVNVINFVSDSDSVFKVSGVESAIFHINWYSKHLIALEEPILSDSIETKVFRFTWLRSFDNPIVISIENNNDSVLLYWKECDGAGGYKPGKIIKNKKKTLTINEWKSLNASIDSINFWVLPTTQSGFLGIDGAQWILEGKELGKYHVVDRWSGGEIENVCKQLMNLANLKIKESEIY